MEITDPVDVAKDNPLLSTECIGQGLLELRVSKDQLVVSYSFLQGTDISLLTAQKLIDNVS